MWVGGTGRHVAGFAHMSGHIYVLLFAYARQQAAQGRGLAASDAGDDQLQQRRGREDVECSGATTNRGAYYHPDLRRGQLTRWRRELAWDDTVRPATCDHLAEWDSRSNPGIARSPASWVAVEGTADVHVLVSIAAAQWDDLTDVSDHDRSRPVSVVRAPARCTHV
jgi:hypothetical protein